MPLAGFSGAGVVVVFTSISQCFTDLRVSVTNVCLKLLICSGACCPLNLPSIPAILQQKEWPHFLCSWDKRQLSSGLPTVSPDAIEELWRQAWGSHHPTDKEFTQEQHFCNVLSYGSECTVRLLECGCVCRVVLESEGNTSLPSVEQCSLVCGCSTLCLVKGSGNRTYNRINYYQTCVQVNCSAAYLQPGPIALYNN